eukprot:CAMPEP_0171098712 /NCGR_PEP_ID=MMETSP0766_2-20121228/49184_1 /TAXON_ID=439317 /ORGANISM="Gambierdiscus australes, Strain CAWD 149" /LENGTH=41 /DNA_ID= /DNA_START= /DNA_END= /DNA_ORIENTATION=
MERAACTGSALASSTSKAMRVKAPGGGGSAPAGELKAGGLS